MIYKDILSILKTYNKAFEEVEKIINELDRILSVHINLSNELTDSLLYLKGININKLIEIYKEELSNAIIKFNFIENMKTIGKFEQRVLTIEEKIGSNVVNGIGFIYKNIIESLTLALKSFYDYQLSRKQEDMLLLLNNLNELKTARANFQTTLRFIEKADSLLEREISENDMNSYLTIKLGTDLDIKSIGEVINSINEMYEYLCGMLNISINEYPLLPAKIESGSLFSKISGHTNVIKLLEHLLKSLAFYIYRNFNNEGKFGNIPNQLDIIEKEFNLLEKLKQSGYINPRAEDELNKQLYILLQHGTNIISKSTKIEINDDEISIYNFDKKQIEYKNRFMLEEKNKVRQDNEDHNENNS